MTQKVFIAKLDRRVHRVLVRNGLADNGEYTASGGNGGVPCQVYIDRQVEVLGDFGQVLEPRDELRFVRVTAAPTQGGRVTIRGEDGQDETWRLVKCLSDDGSVSRWVVQRG